MFDHLRNHWREYIRDGVLLVVGMLIGAFIVGMLGPANGAGFAPGAEAFIELNT